MTTTGVKRLSSGFGAGAAGSPEKSERKAVSRESRMDPVLEILNLGVRVHVLRAGSREPARRAEGSISIR
jgi:hypothetical protein